MGGYVDPRFLTIQQWAERAKKAEAERDKLKAAGRKQKTARKTGDVDVGRHVMGSSGSPPPGFDSMEQFNAGVEQATEQMDVTGRNYCASCDGRLIHCETGPTCGRCKRTRRCRSGYYTLLFVLGLLLIAVVGAL